MLTLGGDRYVVLTEAAYRRLSDAADGIPAGWEPWDEEPEVFARDLVARREVAGLTQAALARAAGIRVETLNRIERGKTTPDFATVRKLVHALREAGRTIN